jgi:hypothetical protein
MALETETQTHKKEPVENGLIQVRQVLNALNGAYKKILLYPPEHVIYQNALESLKNKLDIFLERHQTLLLTIDQNKICYDGEVVHEGSMNEENPAFIFFRDGIYLLELLKSIETWEVHLLLEILKKNQVLTEEAENDVVTALWEAGLPSLRYEAEDVGFDTSEEFEIPELGGIESSEEPPDQTVDEDDGTEYTLSSQALIYDWNLQEITPDDREHLYNMIVEEEEWERVEYVIYILLYILQQQTQPDDFSEVMAFMIQELREALKDHKYQSVYNTLEILNKNLEAQKDRNHWSIPLVKDFFSSLSEKSFLDVLQDDLKEIARCSSDDLDYLKRSLLMLNANAIETLGPMLLKTEANRVKKLLMTVIGIMGEREFESFEKLLSSSDTKLVKMLVHVMGFMKSNLSFNRLLKLLHHTSADIRKQSLKAIFIRKSDRIKDISWLLDDPDEDVQKLFLRYLGQQRNLEAEKLLLDYLKKHRIRAGSKRPLFAAYIALGKCGSDKSLPFLKKDLFFLPFMGILRSKKSLRRQAAIYALNELNTEKAKSLLERKIK